MSTQPPLVAGNLLGRYRLVERLGAGGMGEVWRAVDAALGRDVAVKVLRTEALATPERRRRFETEARTAATLAHPNIVSVYDVGESAGALYIVQELVAGRTVGQILESEGRIPAERAAEWGAQAADGLAAAHAAGILHRDVKPGNLIVGADGRLRVLDFGLAKVLPGKSLAAESVTADGLVVGTVYYMSPEQALGRDLDVRSDVFSLGIVLYEMVTGKRPFEAESAVATMHAIAYEPPRPLEDGGPRVPPGLISILEKALEKSPGERYGSLSEMAIDLRRFLRRSSAGAPTLQGLQPPTRSTREMTGLSGRGAAARTARLVLGVLAGAGLALAAWRLLRPHLPQARVPLSTRFLVQTEACEETPVYSPDGRAFVYAANGRGNYDVYYRLVSGGVPVRLTEDDDDDRQPCLNADGTAVYYTRGDPNGGASSIWTVPSLGGPARKVLDSGDSPWVSRDGRRLLFRRWESGRAALFLADADGGAARRLFVPATGAVSGATISPDGMWVAFFWHENAVGAIGDVWKIPSAGGTPVRLTNDRRDLWGRSDWLPDGSAVLFASVRTGTANIWMVPARGGDVSAVTTGSGWVLSPSVSRDGRSLLVQNEKTMSDAWEYSIPGGRARQLTDSGTAWAPVRLADGRLLYGDWARQEEEIDLYVQDRAGARTYLTEGSNPRVAPDGRTVFFSTASGNGRRSLARVDVDGGPPRRLTDPAGTDEYPDPTPDGQALLFCRTLASGKGELMLLPLGARDAAPRTLFDGESLFSRAGPDDAVFRTCALTAGCGVYAIPYAGGPPRLLVPEGRWPALSSDRRSVYALVGAKQTPVLVRVPLAGGTPERLFAFNPGNDPRFWAIFTLDVARGDGAVVVTQQKNDADVVLLEGIFR